MFKISSQSDYGLLFLSYLSAEKDFVSLSYLVKKTKLPGRFLARIAAQLVKNKIIKSREGKKGGYKLAKRLDKITLYDFLRIFEGELKILKCFNQDYYCRYEKICQHVNFFKYQLGRVLIKEIKNINLKEVIRQF